MSEDNNKKNEKEENVFPFIKGENLDLVPSHPDWNELYCKWSNDPEVRVFARNVMPNTIEDTKKWLKPREEKGAPDHIVMTIWHKQNKKPIGVIGLGDINWFNRWANAFIQIGDKDYWKKGIATEATEMLLKYAFEEVNLNKVSGGVIVENIGSWKVAEKVGFKFEATLKNEFYVNGKYHDVKRYCYLREDWFKAQ
ncbi:MAG: GNAT family N-acetyltransferase [Candidatus Lokiarchaeota archaeon]|nr:GNAT family N-acetyltransferase [Candidatus Lokiarchaeota archaeon]MBD3200407.1 GNAT family N-acetyltransferase [Candidatus Lokiarchaeota archaeon]